MLVHHLQNKTEVRGPHYVPKLRTHPQSGWRPPESQSLPEASCYHVHIIMGKEEMLISVS